MEKKKRTRDFVSETHIDYDMRYNEWSLSGDAVSGGGGFSNGEHLEKFSKESDEKHAQRQRLAYYLNHTAAVVDSYSGHLFKNEIVRSFDSNAELDRFYRGTNLEGDKGINDLMKDAFVNASTYGHCFIVVDRTPPPEGIEIETVAQEEDAGIKTYAYILSPKSVTNWGVDKDGTLSWIIVKEKYKTNQDRWDADHDEMTQYRIWTRNEWFVFDKDADDPKEHGVHNLGIVPVVVVKNVTLEGGVVVGRSDIYEIAKINKSIYNSCSELTELMINNAFSMLAMSSRGMKRDKNNKLSVSVGADRIILFDEKPPLYISPPPQAIAAYETRITNLVESIYKLAKLEYTGGVYPSGIALRFKFEKTNEVIARKAAALEGAERKLANLVLLWSAGNSLNDGVDVNIRYPREFGIVDLAAEADRDEKITSLGFGEVFNATYLKRRVRVYLPDGTPKELADIDTDIDAQVNVDEYSDEFDDDFADKKGIDDGKEEEKV